MAVAQYAGPMGNQKETHIVGFIIFSSDKSNVTHLTHVAIDHVVTLLVVG